MLTFRNISLGHEDCVSGMSFKIDFEHTLQNNRDIKLLRENIYLLLDEIFVLKIPIQKLFWPELFLSTDFQNVCCTFCDKLNA